MHSTKKYVQNLKIYLYETLVLSEHNPFTPGVNSYLFRQCSLTLPTGIQTINQIGFTQTYALGHTMIFPSLIITINKQTKRLIKQQFCREEWEDFSDLQYITALDVHDRQVMCQILLGTELWSSLPKYFLGWSKWKEDLPLNLTSHSTFRVLASVFFLFFGTGN